VESAEPLPVPNEEGALTQAEVERLLSQVGANQDVAIVVTTDGKKEKRAPETIQPYDFRQPAFLTPNELRKLRLWHEDFIRSLAERLSMYLRLEVNLKMSKLQTLVYAKFIEALPNPTYLTLFKAEPLRGICVLDVPTRLGLTVVDRLLGGPAHSVNLQRDLSEIEVALLDQVIQLILGEWCSQWNRLQDLRPVMLGHETNGRYLQTSPRDTVMLALAIEVRIGDCLEQLQLGFPYSTLEPLATLLQGSLEAGKPGQEDAAPASVPWNRILDTVKIPIVAKWQGLEMTVRDMAGLRVGDVLAMNPESAQQIGLELAGLAKFVGRLGTRNNHWAVEITRVLKSET
jgi:flagellar motor switch protein FliM